MYIYIFILYYVTVSGRTGCIAYLQTLSVVRSWPIVKTTVHILYQIFTTIPCLSDHQLYTISQQLSFPAFWISFTQC